jgi:hypothetical protein
MDTLEFTVELIKALAWPVVTVALVVLLRRNIGQIARFVRSLKYKDFEVTFGNLIKEVRSEVEESALTVGDVAQSEQEQAKEQQFLALAEDYPSAAIIEAWKEVEHAVLNVGRNRRYIPPNASISKVVNTLLSKDEVDTGTFNIFNRLRTIRNEVVHSRGAPSIPLGEILEYRDFAKRLARRFNQIAE